MKITIIADKSQITAVHYQVSDLKQKGIEVWFDTKPAIAHNKIILIDESSVLIVPIISRQVPNTETRKTKLL
jgi:hypothetical protein